MDFCSLFEELGEDEEIDYVDDDDNEELVVSSDVSTDEL